MPQGDGSAKRIHDLDQGTGALSNFAAIIGAYHRSLMVEGFTRQEALQIVLSYQQGIIRTLTQRNDGSQS